MLLQSVFLPFVTYFYIFMTCSRTVCTSTTVVRFGTHNVQYKLCIIMPYPNPYLSIQIDPHPTSYQSYPSNHIHIPHHISNAASCPKLCSTLGRFASGGLALDLGFRLVSSLETKAPKHRVVHRVTKHTKTLSRQETPNRGGDPKGWNILLLMIL